MAIARYTDLTAEQRSFYEKAMLVRAVPAFTHLYAGQNGIHPAVTVPEHKGDTISWRKLAAFSAATTALTEGVTPDGESLSISAVTANVAEYGAFVRYSRKAAANGIDDIVAEASDALGEQAGDSLDQITRDVVVAGSTVQYASTATSRVEVATTMELNGAEILEAVATLKNNKARPVVDGKFFGIIHPFAEYDLFQDSTILNVLQHAAARGDQNGAFITGYIGDAFGTRLYCSANAKTWADAGASSADVIAALFIGKGAFGVGGLAGWMPDALMAKPDGEPNTGQEVRPVRLINKDFGSAGADDPLDQRATVGWYTTYVTKILIDTFMVRVEHGSALAP